MGYNSVMIGKNRTVLIRATPHNLPLNGRSLLNEWALIIVDMQNDYCSPGCYMDKQGYDIKRLRKPIVPLSKLVRTAREVGMEIIYARHGEENHHSQENTTSPIGTFGWEIVQELTPMKHEPIFDKSTTSAFASSDIYSYLKSKNIKYLAFGGNTADCCVHSTLRSANDLRFQCLLLTDCCGAVNVRLHKWSIESVTIENGVFGVVTDSKSFVHSLKDQAGFF